MAGYSCQPLTVVAPLSCHGQVLRTLLSLRIKEVQMKKDLEDSQPQKKFMNNKDKKKNLSRMQRKVWLMLTNQRAEELHLTSPECVCVCVCVRAVEES